MNLTTLRDHSFLPSLLDARSTVVDAGGNRGDFSRAIAARFGCRVLVLEPLPELFDSIPTESGVTKFPWALTAASGNFPFHVARNPEANSLRPLRPEEAVGAISVRGISLDDLMREQKLERIDLLKIDVEGAEIEILLGLAENVLARIRQITVEFHAHTLELLSNRAEETQKVQEVIARLRRHGFFTVNRSSPFFIDVLFVNRAACGLSVVQAGLLKGREEWLHRASEGIARRLRARKGKPGS